MKFRKTFIEGPVEFTPIQHKDERGVFSETYSQILLEKNGFNYKFIQENQTTSKKGVFRGIHCQLPPYTQGKLVRVVKGKVVDFAIDLRRTSDTYGQWESVILDGDVGNQFWVPPGFGHAFYTLEDDTIVTYKCTNLYDKEHEVCIDYTDEDINLPLKDLKDLIISDKDKNGIYFMDFNKKNPW